MDYLGDVLTTAFAIAILVVCAAGVAMLVLSFLVGVLWGTPFDLALRRAWEWTTSYPMSPEGFAFTDSQTGEPVYYWRDRHGKRWMATSRWSVFRVAW